MKHLLHGTQGGGLTGPEEKLPGGLADEHFSAADSGGPGLGGLAEQKSLLRIVDRVENTHLGLQGSRGEGRGLDVGVHTDTGGIDDDSGRSLGQLLKRHSRGTKLFGKTLPPGGRAIVDDHLGASMAQASDYGPRSTTSTEDGDFATG